MALTHGTRLGVFTLAQEIGRGGIGEVYLARDTKLDRDVAIKVLPEAFAHEAERLRCLRPSRPSVALLNWRVAPTDVAAVRFEVAAPAVGASGFFQLAPDGRTLVYVAVLDGKNMLWVRAMDSIGPQDLTAWTGRRTPAGASPQSPGPVR